MPTQVILGPRSHVGREVLPRTRLRFKDGLLPIATNVKLIEPFPLIAYAVKIQGCIEVPK